MSVSDLGIGLGISLGSIVAIVGLYWALRRGILQSFELKSKDKAGKVYAEEKKAIETVNDEFARARDKLRALRAGANKPLPTKKTGNRT